ncbi:HHL218Wp [Eremothecium sinecaudum]|uniref:Mediator of RNA polymerase II transcription subunit 12 n=1 Tax=Eremothecium sinecaudum TaxID=45286 RepID=A0A0X8HW09_9SACH|nr:HHL218Wp [Eremothecium sinecaudum]AMD22552.1 HHL218Wp [Eremothecium sinecaudum]
MSPNKYILTPPDDLHPLNGDEANQEKVYPDFEPWSHNSMDDKLLLSYVGKGHYNGAKVNFESISARSSLQESLPKVADMLADQFSKVIQLREQNINKISSTTDENTAVKPKFMDLAGPGFSLPNRVTLTDQRKAQWLQELSSPNVSLGKLAKSIPYGFKRKQILEQCYLKQIPIQRAIWLIESSYAMDWKSSTSKLKPGQTAESVVSQLYNLWTNNMVSIMERLIFEMPKYYNDIGQLKVWKLRVSYYIKLIGNCYSMGLLDKAVFTHWLVEVVEKIENFEFLPLCLHLLSVFWAELCPIPIEGDMPGETFIISKVTSVLLQKYHIVTQSKAMINDENCIINDLQRNAKLKETILGKLKSFILDIFHNQSLEAFIMPNQNWDMYKSCLYDIVGVDKMMGEKSIVIKKKLELITYRNDSLKFNSLTQCSKNLHQGCDNDPMDIDSNELNGLLFVPCIDPEITTILDNVTPGYDWSNFVQQKFTHVEQVIQLIVWAITPSRKSRYDSAHLVAKLVLLKSTSQESLQEYNMEDFIWKFVFHLSKLSESELTNIVTMPNLFELLNIFISYGIIKVPTYIRKLISSGIMYIPDSKDKFFHCRLLINLKVSPLMKNQYNMVLKNIMEYDSTYFTNFNYDQLQNLLAMAREQLLLDDFEDLPAQPISVKIWVSEWYLSYICSPADDGLKKVDRATIMKNFTIFSVHLKEVIHFYKWVEFIVYHQLLLDLDALNALVDILLCYENLLPLLVNDLILFMKTIIHIYSKELRKTDRTSYEVREFNHFWKFFMKNFPYLVELDSDLQLQLAEVYDSERSRIEKLTKSNVDALALYCDINEIHDENLVKFNAHTFPSIFQQNLKTLLKSDDDDARKNAHKSLLLLMIANIGDYNKFMSIFLKRKDFEIEQLIMLISLKLLTLDLVHKVIGEKFLPEIICKSEYSYGLWFELHKKRYIRKNLKLITSICQPSKLPTNNNFFIDILVEHGTCTKLQEQTCSILYNYLKQHKGDYSLIVRLLNYGIPVELLEEEEIVINPTKLYSRLNFTNMWIFQALTKFYTEALLNEELSDGQTMKDFVFEVIDLTKHDVLCSHVFNMVTHVEVIEKLLQVVEADFFKKCLSDEPDDVQFLTVMIETIMTLSRKVNQGKDRIIMDDNSYQLLQRSMEKFSSMDQTSLKNAGTKLNIYLKIFLVHQRFIFNKICESIRQNYTMCSKLPKSLRLLFENTGFDLKLKLLLYDILSSLKSMAIYESTRKPEVSINGRKFNVPEELQNLPPFHISSFLDESMSITKNDFNSLGIKEHEIMNERNDKNHFFIYNKKKKQYECELDVEPFQLLINYQSKEPGINGHCFNDTVLSLNLFDARFDRKNPT